MKLDHNFRYIRRQNGAAFIETSIVSALFLMLVFAVVDLSIIFYDINVVDYSVSSVVNEINSALVNDCAAMTSECQDLDCSDKNAKCVCLMKIARGRIRSKAAELALGHAPVSAERLILDDSALIVAQYPTISEVTPPFTWDGSARINRSIMKVIAQYSPPCLICFLLGGNFTTTVMRQSLIENVNCNVAGSESYQFAS